MSRRKKNMNEHMGEILTSALNIESKLEHFISGYFVNPKTAKTDFMKTGLITDLDFDSKVCAFKRICTKEKYDKNLVDTTFKSIQNIQKIRNNVAHWQREAIKKDVIILQKVNSRGTGKSIREVDDDLMKAVKEFTVSATKGILQLQLLYLRNGTFEQKSDFKFKTMTWKQIFNEMKKFVEHHQKLPSLSSRNKSEKQLGQWCTTQKEQYKKDMLEPEMVRDLKSIEYWYWDNEGLWMLKYNRLKKYINEHGQYPRVHNISQPNTLVTKNEKQLVKWITYNKEHYSGRLESKNFTEKKIKLLQDLPGWRWSEDEKWNKIFAEVKQFSEKYDRLPKSNSKKELERKLGRWGDTQKHIYNGSIPTRKLTRDKVKKLKNINLLEIE